MEDEDELVPQPDRKGFLSLTNRGWIHLDPVLWTMITKIVRTISALFMHFKFMRKDIMF